MTELATLHDQPARPNILYCHCAFAKVISPAVKKAVLQKLAASGVPFEAVPDLCEMSARRDPSLARLAGGSPRLKIAACFPRAVQWLFHAAGSPLDETVDVLNMRESTADEIVEKLLAPSSTKNGGSDD